MTKGSQTTGGSSWARKYGSGNKRPATGKASSFKKKGKFEGYGVYNNLQTGITLERVRYFVVK